VLFGTHYWSGLIAWIREVMLAEGKVSPDDLKLLVVTDSPAEAVRAVTASDAAPEPELSTPSTTPAEPEKHDAQ
jgi:predicted Rossmann-fold nucleotide-binding protein